MSDVKITLSLQDEVSPKLSKVSSAAQNTARKMQAAGKQMDNAFKTGAPDKLASKVGDAVNEMSEGISSVGDAVDKAFKGMEQGIDSALAGSFDDTAKDVDKLTEAVKELDGAYQDAKGRWHDANGKFIKMPSDDGLEKLSEDAEGAGKSLEQAESRANSLSGTLKKLFAVVGAAAILHSVGNFTVDSIGIGRDYSSMVSEVQAISGASANEMAKLEATARSYGATTVFSASEAAEALKYMSLAGWDANQSSAALGGVLNLAAASGMELGQASDMVTDYLSAFGMEANQSAYFADMLAYSQSHSNTTAAELGEAYRNSAANMHAAGQDVETTTSLLEAMANQGLKGSEAGTALAATMRDITQKMENGAIKIGDTSVAVKDAQGNFRDLTDILTDVEDATASKGEVDRAAALGDTFTADSIRGINMLMTEGMDKVAGYEEALRHAGGTAQEMADIMNDNLSGDMANMNSAFEEMQLRIFENLEGPLRDGVQYITGTVLPALTEWVPDAFGAVADGAEKIGNALKPMFETILRNPRAIGTAFAGLGTGVAAFSALGRLGELSSLVSAGKSLTDAGGLVGGLAKLGTTLTAHPWAAGAAAVVGAVTAIGLAVHSYNEQQINQSLSEHFGDMELTAAQAEAMAGQILNAQYMVDIEGSLRQFKNADKLAADAEAALATNDLLEWKARIGVKWDENEVSEYVANIDTFIDSSVKALENETYAATVTIDTVLGNTKDGQTLAAKVREWAAADNLEMEGLSQQLKTAVETAMEDGILNVNEQAAITILQNKMNNILNEWKEADAAAQMDLLKQKYLTGKDLTAESFEKVVEELGKQRESAEEALDQSYTELMSTLHRLEDSGRLQEAGLTFDGVKDQADQAYRNAKADSLTQSVDFGRNTLSDTYGELLDSNYEKIEQNAKTFLENAGSMFSINDKQAVFDQLNAGGLSTSIDSGWLSPPDQQALADRWELMKPDVSAMQSLMEEYRETGQAIPQEFMDSYNNAMMLGAASGDADAAWQVFANQMVADPANDALVQAIQDGTQTAPPELRDALAIALAETTTDPIEMKGLTVALAGMDLDVSQIAELTGMTEEEVQGYLDEYDNIEVEEKANAKMTAGDVTGEETAGKELQEEAQEKADATAGDVTTDGTIDGNYTAGEPNGADTAGQELAGKAKEQAEGAEQPPAEQNIPTTITFEVASLDDSALASAVTDKLKEGDPVPVDVPANVTVKLGEVNSSELSNISDKLGESDPVPVDVPANVTILEGKINTSAAIAAAISQTQTDIDSAFASTFPANGNTDVVLTQTNNVPAIYNEVGEAVRSAFAAGYSASANVNVVLTANYSLANPTKTISFSGGATGSATVSAALHALGGYFDEPHLGMVAEAGVGEYIIPMDGSDRSIGMWEDAGRMLGINTKEESGGLQPLATIREEAELPSGNSSPNEKTINVNVNGSGNIKVSGDGASKEQIVDIMLENLRSVFLRIVEQEILEEGDMTYEY